MMPLVSWYNQVSLRTVGVAKLMYIRVVGSSSKRTLSQRRVAAAHHQREYCHKDEWQQLIIKENIVTKTSGSSWNEMELHNSTFSGIVLILVLSANRCLGYPTNTGYGRLRRTRENMCPNGMNTEQCFYSHLSMYIKLQNSLTNPVSLRNIGKRNSVEQVVPSRDNLKDMDDYAVDDVKDTIRLLLLRTLLETPFITGSDLMSSETDSDKLNGHNFLAVVNRLLETEKKQSDPVYSTNTDDESIGRIVKKSGIICPPTMKRVQCYDNVLAYYIRLLKVIGDQ